MLNRREFLIRSAAASASVATAACAPAGRGGPTLTNGPTSPRIAALERELERGNAAALEAFWQQTKEGGTPLIEPQRGDHSLVTFVWRGGSDTEQLFVRGPVLWTDDMSQVQLRRLSGTDLFYRTYRYRNDLRSTYGFVVDVAPPSVQWDYTDQARALWQTFEAAHQPDPLNLRPAVATYFAAHSSVLELPAAPPQPWVERRDGVATGELHTHSFRSTLLGNERQVWVYTPAGYSGSVPHSLLIAFDESSLRLGRMDVTLDNLLAEGRIPPMVAVFIDTLGRDTRDRELSCYEPFAESLAAELLPWLRESYRITTDPTQVVVVGQSGGGLSAAFVAFRHPELFGNVISHSGSYDWGPGYDWSKGWQEQTFERNWLPNQYAAAPRLPIRLYLAVGLHESYGPWTFDELNSSRQMRDMLEAKGYPHRYVEYNGGHEFICWRGTFADGLIALTGRPQASLLQERRIR